MKRKLNHDDVPEAVGDDAGKEVTPAKPSFASFGLDSRLSQAVNREKFSTPTLVQTKAISLVLGGQDILARAKTGSGKTLAYLLPILHSILHRKKTTPSPSSPKHTAALILVPTKELANQVTSTIKTFTAFCGSEIRSENITRKEDPGVTRARLVPGPDVVVATPSRAAQWTNNEEGLKLDSLKHLVLDEADLLLSYGYSGDLAALASLLPTARVQVLLLSATLTPSTTELKSLFSRNQEAVTLDLSEEESKEEQALEHYVLRTSEEDKFLLVFAIFKLKLVKGKVVIFVGGGSDEDGRWGKGGGSVDRAYRVRLFLEQFGVRSVVLNQEMPVNSRQHVLEEFNRGVYDILIAADESDVIGDEDRGKKRRKIEAEENANAGEEVADEEPQDTQLADAAPTTDNTPSDPPPSRPQKPARTNFRKTRSITDPEHHPSRGLDFRHVSCVLNFDLPTSAKSYTHRVGRTARAGQKGIALSFVVPKEEYRKHKPTSIPQCQHDEKILESIKREISSQGSEVKEWAFDMSKLEPFRYRFTDALRSVTRSAVREARTRELRQELLKSEKLKRHFEENPQELRLLRHDGEMGGGRGMRQRPHLKNVPGYLVPGGVAGGNGVVGKEVGFVGIRGEKEMKRKGRGVGKGRGKGRVGRGGGRGVDPLRSLNVRGRGEK